MDKLKQAFSYTKASQQKEKSKKKQRGKQRTAASVFFGTFGALSEVHFLHSIYHFKSQEVKNLTLQTVYDLELKRGRYGFRKKTAPSLCEIRTTPSACAKLVQNLHNTFQIRTAYAWCEFSSVSTESTLDLFFYIFLYKFPFFSL